MFTFPASSITVVRKKGDEYIQESINTEPVLTGSKMSPEDNRKNVIARLRQDPTVFLVMEPRNGRCEETAEHTSGFRFQVTVQEGENATAALKVTYRDSLAYEESFPEGDGEAYEGYDPEWAVLDKVTEILGDIEAQCYCFVDESCPYFVRREPGDPLSITEAAFMLEGEGYQVERVTTLGDAYEPVMFVSENDIVLLGSRHFDGENLFLELKRCFYLASDNAMDEAVKAADRSDYPVRAIRWDDGSWSFRTDLEYGVDEEGFMDTLNEALRQVRGYIALVESAPKVEAAPWDTARACSHFFIYETLEESRKLAQLKI